MPDLFLTRLVSGSPIYEIYIQKQIDGKNLYCLIQSDSFSDILPIAPSPIPLISFADVDRDAMTDLLFFHDSSVYVFYNKYVANGVSDSNLCKGATDTKYLAANNIYARFSEVGTDLTNI